MYDSLAYHFCAFSTPFALARVGYARLTPLI